MRQYLLPRENGERTSSIDHPGNRTDKAMTIGIVLAGIVALLIIAGFGEPGKSAKHAVAGRRQFHGAQGAGIVTRPRAFGLTRQSRGASASAGALFYGVPSV